MKAIGRIGCLVLGASVVLCMSGCNAGISNIPEKVAVYLESKTLGKEKENTANKGNSEEEKPNIEQIVTDDNYKESDKTRKEENDTDITDKQDAQDKKEDAEANKVQEVKDDTEEKTQDVNRDTEENKNQDVKEDTDKKNEDVSKVPERVEEVFGEGRNEIEIIPDK